MHGFTDPREVNRGSGTLFARPARNTVNLDESPGFVSSLFDTRFETFITPSIIRVVYILFIIFAALSTLGLLFGDYAPFIVRLIVAPLYFFLILIWFRLTLEAIMVLHRIAAHAREIASNTRQQGN